MGISRRSICHPLAVSRRYASQPSGSCSDHGRGARVGLPRQSQGVSEKPRLLDRVREAIARRHYSDRTQETYVHWIKRFIYFSGKRHPAEMGAEEVTSFLNHLAQKRNVA